MIMNWYAIHIIFFVLPGILFWGAACFLGFIFGLSYGVWPFYLAIVGVLCIASGLALFSFLHDGIELNGLKFWFVYIFSFIGFLILLYFFISVFIDALPSYVIINQNIFTQFFDEISIMFFIILWFIPFTSYLLFSTLRKYRANIGN